MALLPIPPSVCPLTPPSPLICPSNHPSVRPFIHPFMAAAGPGRHGYRVLAGVAKPAECDSRRGREVPTCARYAAHAARCLSFATPARACMRLPATLTSRQTR